MNLNVSTILTSHVCCLIPSLFFNFFFKLNRTEKNSKTFGKKTQLKWKNSKMNALTSIDNDKHLLTTSLFF